MDATTLEMLELQAKRVHEAAAEFSRTCEEAVRHGLDVEISVIPNGMVGGSELPIVVTLTSLRFPFWPEKPKGAG